MNFKIHPKERTYFMVMVATSLLMYGILIAAIATKTMPPTNTAICGMYALFLFVFANIVRILLVGTLKNNAIKVTAKQFPEIYTILKSHCQALDIKTIPNMYILQGNGVLNAFAMRATKRNFVVLYADVLELAYQQGMDAVSFIIGHELGHIKRNHVSGLKLLLTFPARLIPFLSKAHSRACEYTCDNIGHALCPTGAVKGLLVLAAGKKLYKQVDINELIKTREHEADFSTWFAEICATHPALIGRVASMDALTTPEDKLTRNDSPYTSPRIDREQNETQC